MDVPSTINALKEVIASYESPSPSTESAILARERLLAQLSSLVFKLERPVDAANRLCAQQMPAAIVKVAMESGLIAEMAKRAEQGSGVGHSADELAKAINAEASLIGRILRYLAAQGLVNEVDVSTFAANEKTIAFAGPGFRGCIEWYFDTISSVYQEVPAYFASRKYRGPSSVVDTVFQAGLKTPESAFVWMQQRPQAMGAFMRYMTVQHHGKENWLSLFPMEKELAAWTNSPERAVFVDVGGGMGHQCVALKQHYPQLQGRIVLQDLPEVIAHANLSPGIEKAPINFLENQPEKGAKFYYLRNILHDWPDKDVLTILKHIRDAMGPESRILIDELVMAAKGSPLLPTQYDMLMMLSLGAAERTLEQWQALLDQAGLKIENRYQYTQISADTLLVVVPK